MAPVRTCVRPYCNSPFIIGQNCFKLSGIKNNYRCLFVRKERIVKIFIDRESLAPHFSKIAISFYDDTQMRANN